MKRFALSLFCALAVLPALLAADDSASKSADAPKADADGFYSLFDGKSLDGWKVNEKPEGFKVVDGAIVVNGERGHAFYAGPVNNHDFKDFHFKAEVMTFPKANSGIYFHTKFQPDGWPAAGYECQVNNSQSDRKRTGGLYAVKDVMDTPPVQDNDRVQSREAGCDGHLVKPVNLVELNQLLAELLVRR